MKRLRKLWKNILLLLFWTAGCTAVAADFTANGIAYNITDASTMTAEVTAGTTKYTGVVSIPQTVENATKSYTVTAVGEFAFKNCTGMNTLTLPETIKTIGSYAFYGCTGLKGIVLPEGLITIGNSAFDGCTGLKTITLPSTLEKIDNCAFWKCSALTVVTLPKNVKKIGYLPFFFCTLLDAINVEADNTTYASEGGILYDKAKTTLLQCNQCIGSTELTVPSGVKTIANSAFFCCANVSALTLPASLTKIEADAFFCPKLSAIHCKSSVPASCEAYVFSNVDTLSCKLYVPTGTKSIYQSSTGWKSFKNIVEESVVGISLSPCQEVKMAVQDDKVTVSGLKNGTTVKLFSVAGQLLGTATVTAGSASFVTKEKIVVAKIEDQKFKVKAK